MKSLRERFKELFGHLECPMPKTATEKTALLDKSPKFFKASSNEAHAQVKDFFAHTNTTAVLVKGVSDKDKDMYAVAVKLGDKATDAYIVEVTDKEVRFSGRSGNKVRFEDSERKKHSAHAIAFHDKTNNALVNFQFCLNETKLTLASKQTISSHVTTSSPTPAQ